MKDKILNQKNVRFVTGCLALCLLIAFGLPLIHHLLIPKDMDDMMERMELNPAELFYTDSERGGEVEFDLMYGE